jgi:hypothetical protein
MSVSTPDLENASAQAVIAYAVERFHPQLTMACSFQKEESVLVHMLLEVEPAARVFTIDTGVLFPETLTTWRAFEERFGVTIEIQDARSTTEPWTAQRCCGARQRAQARARRAAGDLEGQSARRLDREGPLALHPRARPPVPPAPRRRLRVDWLRAVHQARRRARRPVGR